MYQTVLGIKLLEKEKERIFMFLLSFSLVFAGPERGIEVSCALVSWVTDINFYLEGYHSRKMGYNY
ncbi:hypothetical protein CHH67_21460 [Paenibacillus campinasensis]|uniref:Uncharacterized protein n=1 Tax=Paenibacillus campinasensis TaxID=66347 RepID=A0A268EID1_9BACL|nr:hypothetical protein CHH67_21460 [Paenibacillus campinasensis]